MCHIKKERKIVRSMMMYFPRILFVSHFFLSSKIRCIHNCSLFRANNLWNVIFPRYRKWNIINVFVHYTYNMKMRWKFHVCDLGIYVLYTTRRKFYQKNVKKKSKPCYWIWRSEVCVRNDEFIVCAISFYSIFFWRW